MVKLLSTIVLILAIILFPPAALAVISNNAVPGEATYPIKRALEDGIYAVASLNPTTKAWFSAARSDRRFQELSTLLAQGKSASNTLNELVVQTDIAAEQIKKVEDPAKKQELIIQLSESIDKYSQKLDEVSAPQIAVAAPPVNAPTSIQPRETVRPAPTTKPDLSIRPTELPKPPSPSQAVSPVTQPPAAPINPGEVDDAKKKFEEIKKRLEEQKKFNLTPMNEIDKIKMNPLEGKKSNEGDSHPGAGDDESSRRQRNSFNEK